VRGKREKGRREVEIKAVDSEMGVDS